MGRQRKVRDLRIHRIRWRPSIQVETDCLRAWFTLCIPRCSFVAKLHDNTVASDATSRDRYIQTHKRCGRLRCTAGNESGDDAVGKLRKVLTVSDDDTYALADLHCA